MDNELGKYIAEAREKKGISQRDLAKNIKVRIREIITENENILLISSFDKFFL